MPLPSQTLVLWNRQARCAELHENLRAQLESDSSIELVDTVSADDSQARARAAAEAGLPLLIAAGGDGSVHTIVHGLLEVPQTPTVLGILPLGTGNDLCRTLHMPLEPLAAWQTIEAGRTQAIDLTRVTSPHGTGYFTNSANGGNSSRLLDCLDEQMKRDWGTWAYLRAALHVLADMESYQINLTIDDNPPVKHSAWNIVLANGTTAGGGIQIAPRASVTDGLLDVILILDGTPFDLAELATDLLAGDYMEHERVTYCRARRVALEIQPAIDLIVDGETLSGSSFQFEVIPQAIKMIVGTDFQSGSAV